MADELVTVYITQNGDDSYSFSNTGDEGDARTVTLARLGMWEHAEASWKGAQAEMGTVYRSSGF